VHKAQGSQFPEVVLIDQSTCFPYSKRDQARWLYTGITRAEKKLTIIKQEAAITQAMEDDVTRLLGVPSQLLRYAARRRM